MKEGAVEVVEAQREGQGLLRHPTKAAIPEGPEANRPRLIVGIEGIHSHTLPPVKAEGDALLKDVDAEHAHLRV